MAELAQLLPLLRCPTDGSRLLLEDGMALRTPDGQSYPVVDGVPVLIAAERSLFDPSKLGRWGRARDNRPGLRYRLRDWGRWLLHLPPTASRNVAATANFRELRRLLSERRPDAERLPRVLVIGGATEGQGARELLGDRSLELIETDVFIGPRTAVVCDAHDLPFIDGAFDAVVCQAVLEHVLDPPRVASEVWRVLRPGGYVYSEVPFMQQVHEGAFDFTRFTHVGHRRLWRYFDELRSGAQGGPGMALIWSISYFLRAPLPRPLWALADRVASLGFFWLKYLDGWLVRRPGGLDAASGTFFLGRRRPSPVSDHEVVRGYRGGGPRLSQS